MDTTVDRPRGGSAVVAVAPLDPERFQVGHGPGLVRVGLQVLRERRQASLARTVLVGLPHLLELGLDRGVRRVAVVAALLVGVLPEVVELTVAVVVADVLPARRADPDRRPGV